MKFSSTKVIRTGPKSFKLTGDLTMHNIIKPIVLDVTFHGAGNDPFSGKGIIIGFDAKGQKQSARPLLVCLVKGLGRGAQRRTTRTFFHINSISYSAFLRLYINLRSGIRPDLRQHFETWCGHANFICNAATDHRNAREIISAHSKSVTLTISNHRH